MMIARLAPRGCIAAFVVLWTALALFQAPAQTPEYRAFWIDAFHAGFLNQSQVDALLGVPGTTQGGRIREANCNAVFVQVRKRADVCYPSGVGEPYMSGLSPSNFDGLSALIKAAHDTTGGKKRVEVHCWSVAFKTARGQVYRQHSDPPTGSLAVLDNYWPTRLGSTAGPENNDGALDPGHPKALEYLVNAHMDLVNFQTTAGPGGTDGHIDGIHYDYIRFEGGDEGFNPTSVARFNERHGLTGEPDSNSLLFRQWRRDQVSAFVRQMYARIQATKPFIKQSGAFVTWNPSPTSSTRSGFQATRPYGNRSDGVYSDWDSWIQEGILDIAVPMTYYNWDSLPNDYVRWMNFEKDRKGNRHMIIGPGVYLNSLDNAILELLMTREPSPAGNYADGFCCYSYFAPYTTGGTAYGTWPNFVPRFVAEVTPTWADIPSMPWKTNPTSGHLMGTVTLPGHGAWADHATVTISGPVSRSMSVDGTGFYAFIDLPPGTYSIQASKPGYADATASASVVVGAVTGNMFTRDLVLSSLNEAPHISSHPGDRAVVIGQDATFTVAATGTPPLLYQWRFNQETIGGATGAAYTRLAAQPAHAGTYDVIVRNNHGAVTSSPAILTINPPSADIILDNTNPEVAFEGIWQTGSGGEQWGSDYRFSITRVGGTSNAVFRPYIAIPGKYDVSTWYRAGSNRPTNSNWTVVHQNGSLHVAVNQTINGGTWVRLASGVPFLSGTNGCVILSNNSTHEGRAAMADAVRFTLIPAPQIVTQPISSTNLAGSQAAFTLSAIGAQPIAYQWHFNNTPIPGATTNTFNKAAVANTDAGSYFAVLTNPGGSVTSTVATLTVDYPQPPAILTDKPVLVPGGMFHLQFSGGPGRFVVEVSPDLLTWTNRAVIETGTSLFELQDVVQGSPKLFYRLKRDP